MINITHLDIETSYNIVGSWSTHGKQWSALKTFVPWHILCFAWKLDGTKECHVHALCDYSGYKPTVTSRKDGYYIRNVSDKELVHTLWGVLDDADVVVAHNANRFDIKRVNSRFLVHNMPPPSPYEVVDTLAHDRQISQSNSHRLDAIGEERGLGRKLQHTGIELWTGVMSGDPSCWEMMKSYNEQDVYLLEDVYQQLRPWMKSHPNVGLYNNETYACPKCGSQHVQKRGYRRTKTGVYQQYQCMDCHAWSQGNVQLNSAKSETPSKDILK